MALPEPTPRPNSADDPERIYSPSGRPLTGGAAAQAKQHSSQHRQFDEAVPYFRQIMEAQIKSMGGPDQLRRQLGRQTALGIVAFVSGEAAAQNVASNWSRDDADSPRQLSTTAPGAVQQDYRGDPLHDPRVTSAILSGQRQDEVALIIRGVTQEYRDAAAARERRRQQLDAPPAQLRPRHAPISSAAEQPGHVTAAQGNAGQGRWDPVGHRMVYGDGQQGDPWAAYPDHSPEFMARVSGESPSIGSSQMTLPPGLGQPVPPQSCSHFGMTGKKFCGSCGANLAPPSHWTGGAGESPGQAAPPIASNDEPPAEEAPGA